MNRPPWKLNPSDFAFLWEDCKRCFYLKVHEGIFQPRPPMPRIFSVIDEQMKAALRARHTREVLPGMPAGRFGHADDWVQSSVISAGLFAAYYIRGKLDTVITGDDGEYAVIDFKTSDPFAEHVRLYGRQLHAYALALENAAPGHLALKPVRRLGLLVFSPAAFGLEKRDAAALRGSLTWKEIKRDDQEFREFLNEVVAVLSETAPPGPAGDCEWCRYREISRKMKF